MHPSLLIPLALLAVARAQTCNTTSLCRSSNPCCSEFGYCGDDHFCLGGCNPLASHDLESCRPAPVCQDKEYTFPDNSRILSNVTFFDGNASAYDWVIESGNIMNTNSSGGELALLLTKENGGTRISSTRYVHYGTITARLKTARTNGIVTAFITMSDIKDEVDWEFPGAKTTEGQTNFFWQGEIPEKSHGSTTTDLSDTFSNYHNFTIDWQEDRLAWSVDGQEVRSINAADQNGKYPSTPSRVQLSIWPAGIESSAPGTVEWAGGMIPWDSDPDYQQSGHFAVVVSSVSVKCADSASINGNITSYVYSSNGTSPEIILSNRSTLLNGALSSVQIPRGVALFGSLALVGVITSLLTL